MSRSEDAGEDRDKLLHAAALDLDQAERDRVGLHLVSKRLPGLTKAEAWGIADARDGLRVQHGESLTGTSWVGRPK